MVGVTSEVSNWQQLMQHEQLDAAATRNAPLIAESMQSPVESQ